jgi:hypothetical protein
MCFGAGLSTFCLKKEKKRKVDENHLENDKIYNIVNI